MTSTAPKAPSVPPKAALGPMVQGHAFTFTAPAPAGDHKIKATCLDRDCTPEGPDKVWVGHKDLISLPGSNNYVLLQNRDTYHPGNHYMNNGPARKTALLAKRYHDMFRNDPVLRLNDASLERGGLFDIKARSGRPWATPHRSHNRGRNIDVRANPHLYSDAIPHRNFFDFEDMVMSLGGTFIPEDMSLDNAHYHVSF